MSNKFCRLHILILLQALVNDVGIIDKVDGSIKIFSGLKHHIIVLQCPISVQSIHLMLQSLVAVLQMTVIILESMKPS